MTVTEKIKLQHAVYSMKENEVAHLLPAIYESATEDAKVDRRKCLIQIFVPDQATLKKVDKYIGGPIGAIGYTKSGEGINMVFKDYDVHLVITDDFSSNNITNYVGKKLENHKTIGLMVYGKMDIEVEEFLFEKFIRGGKIVGLLVTN